MQAVKRCVFTFRKPWPTPSMALSWLPFCVSLGLWAEASEQRPQTCAVCCDTLEGTCKGCSHKGRSAHLPW